MALPTAKLAARVKAYRVGRAFYLQEAEKVYSLDEFPDPELLGTFLTWLSQGIDVAEAAAQLTDKEKMLFDDLLSHLQAYGFLQQSGTTAETPKLPLSVRQYPQRELNATEQAKLAQAKILLSGDTHGHLHDELSRQLAFYAVSVQTQESVRASGQAGAKLTILVKTRDTSEHELLDFNRRAFAEGRKWLPVDLSLARYGVYGPLINPPATPCYQCFCERRWINQDIVMRHGLQKTTTIQPGDPIVYRWQYSLMSALLAHEILGFCLQAKPITYAHVVYVDFHKIEIWQEPLLRYPACPVCGGSPLSPSWQSENGPETRRLL